MKTNTSCKYIGKNWKTTRLVSDNHWVSKIVSPVVYEPFAILKNYRRVANNKEKLEVQNVALELLETFKQEKLLPRLHQSKAAIKVAIEQILDYKSR